MPSWKGSSGKSYPIEYDGLTDRQIAKERTYQASKSRGKGPKRQGGRRVSKVSKGASAGRIEHLQHKPAYGQPQYSSKINAAAMQRTNELAKFLSNAAREAARRQSN